MKRIAITGSSGYLGSRLVAALAGRRDVEHLLGLDLRPPAGTPPEPFRFLAVDVRRPFADAFVSSGIDAAVHLAFVFEPIHDRRRATAVNIDGTRHFLDACRAAGVGRALVLGSTTAYGARPDNPPQLLETSPLRAEPAFQYGYEKRLCDEMCRAFAAEHPAMALATCRAPIVLGAHVSNYVARVVFKPKVVHVRDCDPAMQFLHEDDLPAAVLALLDAGATGVFNIAGEGTVRFTEIADEFRRAPLGLPEWALRGVAGLSYALRMRWLNEMPPGAIPYIQYPWVADGAKMRSTTGFRFQHDSRSALRAWRAAVLDRIARGEPAPGRIRVKGEKATTSA